MKAAVQQRAWLDFVGLGLALAGLVLYFGVTTEHFLSIANLRTIANQIPAELVIATGMTFVLVAGGIDLSVGSVLAFSSAVLGVSMVRLGWPLPLAMLASVCAGLVCGAINASIITGWRVPSFIVTLGMLEAARGGTYLVTGSETAYLGQRIEWIADWSLAGVSLPILFALCIVLGAHVILTQTAFGRRLVALGYNEETARLSGINTVQIRWMVFAAAGGLAGVASILHTARLSASDPNSGIGLELNAIAAVVIGGTSLSGGRGSVLRSAVGVIIIAVLGSGLAQAGAQEPLKRLITGAVIVGAVVLDQWRRPARS